MDPIYAVNLILCIIIFLLGYLAWDASRRKNKTPFYIGIAFGLFGISHFVILMGHKETFEYGLIVIRTIAYLIVMYTLWQIWCKKK